jgi:hypothetical protein
LNTLCMFKGGTTIYALTRQDDFIPNLQSFVKTFEMDPITQICTCFRLFIYMYIN